MSRGATVFTPRINFVAQQDTQLHRLAHAALIGHGRANITVTMPNGQTYDFAIVYTGGNNMLHTTQTEQ